MRNSSLSCDVCALSNAKGMYKNMKRKLLIIGNGFDIEHGLLTKYTDFLNFLEKRFDNDTIEYELQNQLLNIIKHRTAVLQNCRFDNILLSYIYEAYLYNKGQKQNWVDFEAELQDFIIKNENCMRRNNKEKVGQLYYGNSYEAVHNEFILPSIVEEDLERIICAYEIYVTKYINKRKIYWYTNDIKPFNPDYVLSFNYSNTFERMYGEKYNVDYCYVHGKAQLLEVDQDKLNNNIVLGIDEHLNSKEADILTEYVFCRKYFQRICKGTGIKYKKWLAEMDSKYDDYKKQRTFDSSVKPELNVMVFGHSLAKTDSDILKEILCKEYSNITIYYHNYESKKKQISNLVNVLGKDKLIEFCYSDKPKILFQKQLPRESICGF